MMTNILETKFFIPPCRQNLVLREGLFHRLDESLAAFCRLTLISAPAGYGKTTLLSAWIHRLLEREGQMPTPLRVAWLSLDATDRDPLVFWTYGLEALRRQDPRIGEQARGLLRSAASTGFEACLISLLNDISRLDGLCILALDDFHLLHSPEIDASLSFFLERLPPQMHVLLSTRSDPSLPLVKMRGRGQLFELRLTDLRFSAREAGDFLNRLMGLQLDSQAVAALNDRAEGWAAGLQMAAVSLQNQQGVEQFISSFSGSNRYILDYLIEEVLQRQPQDVQDFLLQTCILERMCAPLCDMLRTNTERPSTDSQEILAYLERSNLFIIPLDEQRIWYRYHTLFAELLNKQLLQMVPEQISMLHLRAAAWYEENGMLDQAIEHALQGQDAARAARLIDSSADEMLWRGEYSWLLRWIQKLPELKMKGHLRLLLIKAAIQASNGCLDDAEKTLLTIETRQQDEEHGQGFQDWYRGRAASVRALMAYYRGDSHEARRYARDGLEHLPQGAASPWRSSILITLGCTLLEEGEAAASCQVLREAIAGGRHVQHVMLTLEPSVHLASALWLLGDIRAATQVCLDALNDIERYGWQQAPSAAKLYINRGFLLTEQHCLDEAQVYFKKGLDLCQRGSHRWALDWASSLWARYWIARMDLSQALQVLNDCEKRERAADIPAWISNANAGLKAEVLVRAGRLEQAAACLDEQGGDSGAEQRDFHPLQLHARLYLLRAQGELQQARLLAGRLQQAYASAGQTAWAIRSTVLLATLCEAAGDRSEALGHLQQVLARLPQQDSLQVVLDEGVFILPLLQAACEAGVEVESARRLLEALDVSPPAGEEYLRAPVVLEQQECLTARELQVMRLVIGGLGNKEIAARLCLSLRTVKYHTSNIYRKLGVRNRAQAIARARQMSILD